MTSMKSTALVLIATLSVSGIAHARCFETTPGEGSLTFTATSAGAPTRGEFTTYRGTLCLPEDLADASALIEIETQSIDMGLPEFDAEMRGPLFFDSPRWPLARFEATRITALTTTRYRAEGNLTIRDVTRPLTTEFDAAPAGDGLEVSGAFSLDRLDFDLGLGEWQDTAWVGAEVMVAVEAKLAPVSPAAETKTPP